MTTSKRKWATSRSASRAVPTLRTVWEASVRCRMRAERTNWSSSTTSTLAMGGTVRHSEADPEVSRDGRGRGAVWPAMRRGLVHAVAWSLATGAAVTLSWCGVHTVMAGTAYDPPRALPMSGDSASAQGPEAAASSTTARTAPTRRLVRAVRARTSKPPEPATPTLGREPSQSAAGASQPPAPRTRGERARRHASTAAGSSSTSHDDYATLVSATPDGGLADTGVEGHDLDPGDVHQGRREVLVRLLHAGTTVHRASRVHAELTRPRYGRPLDAVRHAAATASQRKTPSGGSGEATWRLASVTGGAPAVKSASARPCSTRPGAGRPRAPRSARRPAAPRPRRAVRRCRSACRAARPGRRRSASAGNTAAAVATWARRWQRAAAPRRPCRRIRSVREVGGVEPAGRSTRRTSRRNSALVRCAGVRAPLNTSAMTRSAQPSGSLPSPSRASAPRTRIRQPGPTAVAVRTHWTSAASSSTTCWVERGRVAAT